MRQNILSVKLSRALKVTLKKNRDGCVFKYFLVLHNVFSIQLGVSSVIEKF